MKRILLFFAIGAQVNAALAFFNIIPLFPLDGSHILYGILPRGLAATYDRHTPYGMFILIGLVLLGNLTGLNVLGLLIGVPMSLSLWLVMGSELMNFVVSQAPYL